LTAHTTIDVLEVCEQALEHEPDVRTAWLEAAHGDNPALIAAVQRLLDRDAASGRLLPTDFAPPLPPTEPLPPPERVGVYRLVEPIGEGGMGSVFRAERDDGLFEHVVAVKLVSGRHFDRRASERFAVERQALARLKHPNIARLLDGGVTADGVPYLLMDYVEGVTILEHIEETDPSVAEVVGLLLQVCDAVADAHRKLVVHGDLKPSNILVTPAGEARLLDFGVARLTDIAGETSAQRAPLTAAYASPERRKGEPPTTADDVYALGLLLRELVSRSGPSLRKETLPRPLPRDLDAIASQAAAADPQGRYGSAGALAADLRRWQGREPVLARARTFAYVLGRYLARRPRFSAAAAAAVLGLAVTATVSTVLYFQAEAARRDANRRFDDARSMAKYMLFGLYDQLAATPQSLTLRRDLARRGQSYLDQLSSDSRAPLGVKLEAADGLARLAAVQGGVGGANLGDAAANLDHAEAILAGLAEGEPGRSDVQISLARTHLAKAELLAQAYSDPKQAERKIGEAEGAFARARALGAAPAVLAELRVELDLLAAAIQQWQGRYRESIAAANRAIMGLAGLSAPVRDRLETQLLAVRAHDVLAEGKYYSEDIAGSAASYRQATAIAERLHARYPRNPTVLRRLATEQWALGTALIDLKQPKDALAVLEAGLVNARRLVAYDDSDNDARRRLGIVMVAKAQALSALDRDSEAVALLKEAADERRAFMTANPNRPEAARDYAVALVSLADVRFDAGRVADACRDYGEAKDFYAGYARAGRLTSLDTDHNLKLLNDHAAQRCGRAGPRKTPPAR
jgi:eukaryotic-like serine/threonine-protein kinase